MSTSTVNPSPFAWMFTGRFVVRLFNWLAILVVGCWSLYQSFYKLYSISSADEIINNPLYYEFNGWVIGGAVIWLIIQAIAILSILDDLCGEENFYFFPRWFGNKLWWCTISTLLCFGFVYANVAYYEAQNLQIGTPYGHVRIMEGGDIIPYGNTVVHDPTHASSVLVALKQPVSHTFLIGKGVYQKLINVTGTVSLSENGPWMDLSQRVEDLGFGNLPGVRKVAQEIFFENLTIPAFEPAVKQVVREISTGALQGGNGVFKLRFGDVFHSMIKNNVVDVPPRIGEIEITSFHVVGWREALQ
ncbi:hypothetical protein ACFL6I_24270 [candidate division KSB1 bacterium]